MKQLLSWSWLSLLLLSTLLSWAQSAQTLSSEITAVTVYRQRAQITREAEINVQKGENVLTFSGLSQHILPNSINVSGYGRGIIQSVRHRVSYLDRVAVPAQVQRLEDSVAHLQAELARNRDEQFVNQSEEELLLANQNLDGQQSGLDVAALKEMATLYRERLTEVRANLRTLDREQKKLNQRVQQLQQEISSLQRQRNQPTQEVVVVFVAEAADRVELTLTYLVNQASWTPFYDLRVSSTSDPIQLALKANVVNNTGTDWQGVKIRLSTTKNTGNNQAPDLDPQYVAMVDYDQIRRRREEAANERQLRLGMGERRLMAADARSNTMAGGMADMEEAEVSSSAAYTTTNEGELGLEFDIALTYDIPADGQEHQVDILQSQLEAAYHHYTVPKLDPDVFLVADIREDLLRGQANVYFEGSFVGESYVDTDNPRDSLRLSLGRDPKVQVQREQVKDYTARQALGGKERQTFAYEITLRNNQAEAVSVFVQDQLPISQNKDITVEPLEISGARLDENSGRLDWTLELAPGEERTLVFRYEVKYPKDADIRGL